MKNNFKMMSKQLQKATLFIFLTLGMNLYAQSFQVKEVYYNGNGYEYTFPLLQGNSPAITKINDFLWSNWLHILPGKYNDNAFEKIGIPEKGANQGVTDMGYAVFRNDSKVFSVGISYEYSGVNLNEYSTVYNFDALTGTHISFYDLMTPAGRKIVGKKLKNTRIHRLKAYLKTLDTTRNGNTTPENYQVFKLCLQSWQQPDHSPWGGDIVLYKNTVAFTANSCGNSRLFRKTDTANIYRDKLSFQYLKPYLTHYGRCVLSDQKENCQIPPEEIPILGRVYKGKINNKYPITFIMTEIYRSKKFAVYYYDKYGQEINLEATNIIGDTPTVGDQFDFQAFDKDNQPLPEVLHLTVEKNDLLKGTWTKGEKTYPIVLK